MAEISKKQAQQIVEKILHKINCCELVQNIESNLTRSGSDWIFESPERTDIGAKQRAVEIRLHPNGTWEAHNYQFRDNAYGTFSFSAEKLIVSVHDL